MRSLFGIGLSSFLAAGVGTVLLSGCGRGLALYSRTAPALLLERVTADLSSATLSSASVLELQSSNTELSVKVASTTDVESCTGVAGSLNNGFDGSFDRFSGSFSASSTHALGQVALGLATFGSPTGDVALELRSDSAGNPGALIATSASLPVVAIDTNAFPFKNAARTFIFNSSIQVVSGTTYHLVLIPIAGYNGNGANKVRWGSASSPGGTCTSGHLRRSTDTGATWSDEFSDPPKMTIQQVSYPTSDVTAAWVLDAGKTVDWALDSFSVSENPHGELGSLTYDLGVSDDSSSSYELFSRSRSQITSESDLRKGRYLLLRAHFGTSSGSADATISSVGVSYVR